MTNKTGTVLLILGVWLFNFAIRALIQAAVIALGIVIAYRIIF